MNAIRTALQSLVNDASSALVENKYEGDSWEIGEADGVSSTVFLETEDIEYMTIGPTRSLDHICEWRIESVTKSFASGSPVVHAQTLLETAVQSITDQITDRTLGGIVHDTKITGSEYKFNNEGDQTVGIAILRLETFHTTTKTD